MVAGKAFPPSNVSPGDVDRTLALNKPDHLGHRVFRRNGDQHVYVVRNQVSLLNLAFSLPSQVVKHLAQILAKLSVQGLTAIFRDKHYMVLAFPFCMLQAFL